MFVLSPRRRPRERATRAADFKRNQGLALLVLASLVLPRLLPWVEIYVHRGHVGHGPCCGSLAGCACPIDAAPAESSAMHHGGHTKPSAATSPEHQSAPDRPSCHDDRGLRFAHCGEHPGTSPPERLITLPADATITAPSAVGRAFAETDSLALDVLTSPPTPPPDPFPFA